MFIIALLEIKFQIVYLSLNFNVNFPVFPYNKATWAWYFSSRFLDKLTFSSFHYNMEILGGALKSLHTVTNTLLLLHPYTAQQYFL